MKKFMIVAATLLGDAPPAWAQYQVRDSGEGYLNLSLQFQSGDSFFDSRGATSEGRTLEQVILSTYGEIGVVDRWLMLTLAADLVRRNVLPEQGATTGLGDIRVGAWTEAIRLDRFRLLGGVQFGLPTGDADPSSGDGVTQNEQIANTLPTGDGEFDIQPTLILSTNFDRPGYPLRHYALARVGYWIRTDGFTDALSYGAELGTQIAEPGWDRLWFTVRFRGVEAFDEVEAGTGGGGIGIGNGVSYTVLGGEAQVRLPGGLSVGLGVDGPLRGRGILNAVAVRGLLGFEFGP